MGKPKKSSSSAVKEVIKKVEQQLGKKAQYIGLLGARFSCPICNRSFKRGMVSEYQGKLYCSEDCVKLSTK